ncbi:MAG: NAD(P)-binding domain-containing protein, partial [Clostridia bacterium]|nr:NAD(P)-binding domain-containing protein [Clostridia bacterium]
MKISVLGCGRWGSFLAWYLDSQKNDVVMWGRPDSKSFLQLKNTGKNEYVTLSDTIILTSDLGYAINHAEVVIISISSQSLRPFIAELLKYNVKDKIFCLCMKGIEEATGLRLTEVAIECGLDKNNLAVWVGPGHIQSFTN